MWGSTAPVGRLPHPVQWTRPGYIRQCGAAAGQLCLWHHPSNTFYPYCAKAKNSLAVILEFPNGFMK